MRGLVSGLLACTLALAACQAGAPGTSPRPAGASPTPRATRAPGEVPAASPPGTPLQPGATPAAAGGYEKLRRPAGATAVLKGRLQLDAAYMVAAGAGNAVQIDGMRAIAADGGTLIGQDGGSLIGQDGGSLIGQDGGSLAGRPSALVANARNQIVAAGAGNVIARTATLVDANGNALIGLDGGSLVGNSGNTYRLAQASPPAFERAPVVGALVGVIDLRTGRPLSLGKDAQGGDVYLVYSDAAGGFELFLPPDAARNVLVVAAPPGARDGRLHVNVLVPEAERGAVEADELRSLITDYLRACVALKIADAMDAPDPVKALSQDNIVRAVLSTILPDLVERARAVGFAGLPLGARRRAVQAGVDRILADVDLGQVVIPPERMGRNPYGPQALAAMKAALAELESHAGERPLPADADVLAFANQLAPADRPWRLTKGHDLNDMLVRSFVLQNHDTWFDQIGIAAMAVGADPRVEDAIAAAGLAFFYDLTLKFFQDADRAAGTMDAIVEATKAEVAAARTEPVAGPTPSPPAGPVATAALAGTLPGEPAPDAQAPAGRKWPVGLALDGRGPTPTLYAADRQGRQVWRLVPGQAPVAVAPADAFAAPSAVALGPDGTLYVADRERHAVYAVATPHGAPAAPTPVAGRPGEKGPAEPSAVPGLSAHLDAPEGLAIGADGALYVAEAGNHVVRRIDLATAERRTAVFAGGVDPGPKGGAPVGSYLDDVGRKARFKAPAGVAAGPRGLFVADRDDTRLRLATMPGGGHDEAGPVVAVAGGAWEVLARPAGPAFLTRVEAATALAADAAGRVYVAGKAADGLRVLVPGSWLLPVGGLAAGTLVAPSGLALAPDGKTLYVANGGDRRIHALTLTP